MKDIKNRSEVVESLTEILVQFDKKCNRYQTDVYAYYDAETGTVTLDTFVNVGGNSWLDDEHETIYSDREHFEGAYDWYQTIGEFADALDITEEQLLAEVRTANDYDYDEDDPVDWIDARDYIKSRSDYDDKVIAAYEAYIDDIRSEYAAKAEDIISDYESR